jgi:hypothetical protein
MIYREIYNVRTSLVVRLYGVVGKQARRSNLLVRQIAGVVVKCEGQNGGACSVLLFVSTASAAAAGLIPIP